jgi:two-component system copper resistance phosphate regulon response regulator CusR
MLVLVVEDDDRLAKTLGKGLEEARYSAATCRSVAEARRRLAAEPVDLILLDLGLADGDGLDLLRAIRREGLRIPVLIITARDAIPDRVQGLDAGADDYLVKPFAFAELLARIRARLNRAEPQVSTRLEVGDLVVDVVTRRVTRRERAVELTPQEFSVLHYLALRAGKIVSREMLARDVWQVRSRATPMDNVIDVHISHLREKIDRGFDGPLIQTIRGVGFRLGGES